MLYFLKYSKEKLLDLKNTFIFNSDIFIQPCMCKLCDL